MSGVFLKLFRIAFLPESAKKEIESEGEVFIVERVRVTVIFHRFKSQGRSFDDKRETGWGSLALSEKRLIGFIFRKKVIDLPLKNLKAETVKFSSFDGKVFCINADASAFGSERSGRIEVRYHTDRADELYSAVAGRIVR